MRKPLAIAISLALSSPVWAAETASTISADTHTTPSVSVPAFNDLEGKAVYGKNNEKLGDIDRLVLKDGKQTAIIGIDGVFDGGAKEVAVPLSELQRTAGKHGVTVGYTEAQLKAMPDVDPFDFKEIDIDDYDYARAEMKPDPVTGLRFNRDIEGAEVYSKQNKKVGDVDRVVAKNGQRFVIIGLDGIVGDGAKEVAVPFEKVKRGANDEQIMVRVSDADLRAMPDVDPLDFQRVESNDRVALRDRDGDRHPFALGRDLEDMEVYDSTGKKVGDIDRLVMHNGAKTAVVGLDGFVGDGAKEVAVPFSKLTRSGDGDNRVNVAYTDAQLKAMPDVDPAAFKDIQWDEKMQAKAKHMKADAKEMTAEAKNEAKRMANKVERKVENTHWTWNGVEGMDVYDVSGKKVGDVDRLVVKDGQKTAIIGIDGIVGAGAKEVAVPFSKINRSFDGERLSVSYSEGELKALPDVDPGDFEAFESERVEPFAVRIRQ